ncbi:hypothetical protein BG000_005293 [Podila horticola]|nr:hypothetical protein BG000_005293 [Podila horticola]
MLTVHNYLETERAADAQECWNMILAMYQKSNKRRRYINEMMDECEQGRLDMVNTMAKMAHEWKQIHTAVEENALAQQANPDLPPHPFEGGGDWIMQKLEECKEVISSFEDMKACFQEPPQKKSDLREGKEIFDTEDILEDVKPVGEVKEEGPREDDLRLTL